MAKSLCYLLMLVNHVADMSLKAIREIKILAKISEFTVFQVFHVNATQNSWCSIYMKYLINRNTTL